MALAILAPHVTVVEGPANGVMVERNDKKLAVYGDPGGKAERVDRVLFTHHMRDVIWVGRSLVERGARAVVPAAEEPLFTGVAAFWDKRRTARFHDYVMETARPPREAFSAVEGVRPGDAID
jgi:glyoxylase-like metal-dependent hydrolase (beta-lactamase superfamily II)